MKTKTIGYVAAVVGLVVVAAVVIPFLVLNLGAVFQPPAPPPEEYSTGYFTVVVRDGLTNSTLAPGDVTVLLFDYETESHYDTIQNEQTYYISTPTFAIINSSGYYNETVAIYARNDSGNPYIDTYLLYKKCLDPADVKIRMIKIDENYGNFTAPDVPTGVHQLRFSFNLTGSSYNQSRYGAGAYIPSSILDANTYAVNQSATFEGTFLAFNGSVSDFQTGEVMLPLWNVSTYNVTYIPAIYGYYEMNIQLNVSVLYNITLFTGLLDDFQQYDQAL